METLRKPFNGPLYGLSQALSIASTVPGTHKGLRILYLTTASAISVYLITSTTTEDSAVNLALGSTILTQLFSFIDFALLSDPDKLVNYKNPLPKGQKISEQPLLERVKWALMLPLNPRGIGWAHEPIPLPPRSLATESRARFVLNKLVTIGLSAAVEGSLYVLNTINPGMNGTLPGYLSSAPIHWRLLGSLAYGICGMSRMQAMHCALSAVVVGLGFSSPDRWPDLFGSVWDAWSIQRLWRLVWHQLLRKSVVTSTNLILRLIGYPLPTLTTGNEKLKSLPIHIKLLRVLIAFTIVGLVHVGGEIMVLQGKLGWGAAIFFVLQGVAVIIESIVSSLWNAGDKPPSNTGKANFKPTLFVRSVGYVWVLSVLTFSLPFMIDPLVSAGFFDDPRVQGLAEDALSRVRLFVK